MANVVVADGWTVRVFRTVAAAERAIEPRDAVGGIIRTWDETGRRLRLEVGDAVCLDAARVSLDLDGSPSADLRELQTVLRNHLDASGVVRRADASLAELLELAVEHDGYAG